MEDLQTTLENERIFGSVMGIGSRVGALYGHRPLTFYVMKQKVDAGCDVIMADGCDFESCHETGDCVFSDPVLSDLDIRQLNAFVDSLYSVDCDEKSVSDELLLLSEESLVFLGACCRGIQENEEVIHRTRRALSNNPLH